MSRARVLDRPQRSGPYGEVARIDVHLPPELKKKVALRAAETGKTLAAVVVEALEKLFEEGG